jgi:hypothetical protein
MAIRSVLAALFCSSLINAVYVIDDEGRGILKLK